MACVGIEIGHSFIRVAILTESEDRGRRRFSPYQSRLEPGATTWQFELPVAITFTDHSCFIGDSSQVVLWESPRVRALICGTYDPSSVLHMLHLNNHILERLLRESGAHGQTIPSPRSVLTDRLAGLPLGSDYRPEEQVVHVMHLCQERAVQGFELYEMLIDKLMAALMAELDIVQEWKAVVCVPAGFNDSQRHVTKDAVQSHGRVDVLRVINEPTAVAIGLSLERDSDGQCDDAEAGHLIVDVGPNSMALTLLVIEDGIFEIALNRVHELSGAVGSEERPQQVWQLLEAACADSEQDIRRLGYSFFDGTISSLGSIVVYSSEGLDTAPVCGFIRDQIQQNPKEVAVLGPEPFAVAWGAATQANLLVSPPQENYGLCCIMDVTPLSLGVQTAHNETMAVVVPRNCTIPHKKSQEFTASPDCQGRVLINILEGERACARDVNQLGSMVLTLTNHTEPTPFIDVCFDTDANGILRVTASEVQGEGFQEIIISDNHLTIDGITRQITDAEIHADDDANARQQAEADHRERQQAGIVALQLPSYTPADDSEPR